MSSQHSVTAVSEDKCLYRSGGGGCAVMRDRRRGGEGVGDSPAFISGSVEGQRMDSAG